MSIEKALLDLKKTMDDLDKITENRVEAFVPYFTEEEGIEHMKQILARIPGTEIMLYNSDGTTAKVQYAGLAPENKSGVTFIIVREGQIYMGFAPFCCIQTSVTTRKMNDYLLSQTATSTLGQ